MTRSIPTTVEAIESFLRENHPGFTMLDENDLRYWIAWNNEQGFLIALFDDENDISGLVVARPVMKIEDAEIAYNFDPEGSIIFVDCIIPKSTDGLKALTVGLAQRFGRRELVAWGGRKGDKKIHMHKAEKVVNRVL